MTAPEEEDPLQTLADEIALEEMQGLRDLLPEEDGQLLEGLLAAALAHQPELRRMVRRLAPDPQVARSGEVAKDERSPSEGLAANASKGSASREDR